MIVYLIRNACSKQLQNGECYVKFLLKKLLQVFAFLCQLDNTKHITECVSEQLNWIGMYGIILSRVSFSSTSCACEKNLVWY
jgi:hypothetical protein